MKMKFFSETVFTQLIIVNMKTVFFAEKQTCFGFYAKIRNFYIDTLLYLHF